MLNTHHHTHSRLLGGWGRRGGAFQAAIPLLEAEEANVVRYANNQWWQGKEGGERGAPSSHRQLRSP